MPSALKSPDPAAALYAEAVSLVHVGRDSEASQRLDAAIGLRPDFAEAFALGGFILERGGRTEVALNFYERALSLKREQPRVWFNLAKLLTRAGRFLEAVAALDAGLA